MKEQIAIQNLLRSNLLDLQSKNPQYSLRAFSKKVDIHVGALSGIMGGKRKISREMAERIVRQLMIDPQKRTELLELFPKKAEKKNGEESDLPRYMEIEASQFKMISEWEHYAILSLFNCSDFKDDTKWMAQRIGITEQRAEEVIKRLFTLQFIKRNAEDKLVRVHSQVRSSDDTINLSLRKSHEVTLDLAKESLHRDGVSERDFTYVTMAIDPKKISVAKEMIRRFQDELSAELEMGERTEVYRFSTQLFPFTKLTKTNGVQNEN
jgi:uncharacterized protein (TIGR02147 family)